MKTPKKVQKKKLSGKIMKKNNCQYNFSNCQKIATFQQIIKLGAVKIDKG